MDLAAAIGQPELLTPRAVPVPQEKAGEVNGYVYDTQGRIISDDPAKRITPQLAYLTRMQAAYGDQWNKLPQLAPFRDRLHMELQDPRNLQAFKAQELQAKERDKNFFKAVQNGDIDGMYHYGSPEQIREAQKFMMSGGLVDLKKKELELRTLVQGGGAGKTEVRPLLADDSRKLQSILGVRNQIEAIKGSYANADASPWVGKIRQQWNKVAKGDAPASELDAMIIATVPGLARGVFGEVGVLTDADMERYRRLFPTLDTPEQTAAALSTVLETALNRAAKSFLDVAEISQYDVNGIKGILQKNGFDVGDKQAQSVTSSQELREMVRGGKIKAGDTIKVGSTTMVLTPEQIKNLQ